jgi:tetratricopeptide (TPR) repeat protein
MGEPASQGVQLTAASRVDDDARRDRARHGRLVGVEPVDNVVMMEDHDGAYYAWRQAGVRGRILLHIDAHIDWARVSDRDPRDLLRARSLAEVESLLRERCLWNLSDRKPDELVHIGNYIYPALKERIVKEFYWIVPDSFMESPAQRKNLVRQFQILQSINPRAMKTIAITDHRVVAELDNTRVTACTLSHLPDIQEPMLLDIDTDFLMPEPSVSARAGEDLWKQLPWIWPDELVARLKDKGVRSDFVTIAYSVEGGFTPLPYKYLGDELALRLKHPELPERHRERLAHKRRGAFYRHDNELEKAIAEYEIAVVLAPEDASSHFALAYLYDEKESSDRGAARYRQAVQLDPTYATAYNNFGAVYQSLGIHDHAQEEYQRILRWDPHNTDAQYGLAELLAQHERWEAASSLYRTVIESRPGHANAHRGLGYVYAKRGLWDEAISRLNRAIALRPDAGVAHFWLGEAYSRQRRWDEAIEAYRAALRCGVRTVTTHRRLGRLYVRRRNFHKALKQYRMGLRAWGWRTLDSIQLRSRTLFKGLSRVRQSCSR